MALKTWLGVVLAFLPLQSVLAKDEAPKERPSQLPLLVIGASYSEGKTPFDGGVAPLGGISVGFGSYLSLGQALTREKALPGFVINEAQAGATTFARPACAPGADACGPAGWDSYETQLQKALARVALPPTFTQANAKYVVITTPNDCLHADAFGIPQSQSRPCSLEQMNQVVDRLIAVGHLALSRGLTPVYDLYPAYAQLDLPLFQRQFGLAWVISQNDFHTLRTLQHGRLAAELPQALVLDLWKEFEHLGDGIHPNNETARKAAHLLAQELVKRDDP
jgi:hypothetical protein